MKKIISLFIFLLLIGAGCKREVIKFQADNGMFKDWQKRWYYNPHTKKLEVKDFCVEVNYFNLEDK